ncbi:MAG TPA: ThiF family adenylyltransferase, partial [Cytophagaceae bacterium]
MLSSDELKRYHRHIILPGFGLEAQKKLKEARILVVGAGGLGCPILQYLAAAGIGKIGIIDGDRVEESNLQRQVLFNVDDIGKNKARCAAEKLKLQNPFVELEHFEFMLHKENALNIISKYDLVIDGCDN